MDEPGSFGGRGLPDVCALDDASGCESAGAVPRRVLVATDTSATSEGSERAGIEIAATTGASLIFMSVIDPSRLRLPGGLFHTRVDQVRARRQAALAALVATARKRHIPTQFLIWEGEPGASVIEAAAAEGADMIIIGSHARGLVGRLLLGSVSSYVVEHAPQQVVVIRPGQRLEDVWPPVPADRPSNPVTTRHG